MWVETFTVPEGADVDLLLIYPPELVFQNKYLFNNHKGMGC